jgi:hypothetical protein
VLFDNIATQLHSNGNSSGEPPNVRITLGGDEIIGRRYVGNSQKVTTPLTGEIPQMLRECGLPEIHIVNLLRKMLQTTYLGGRASTGKG